MTEDVSRPARAGAAKVPPVDRLRNRGIAAALALATALLTWPPAPARAVTPSEPAVVLAKGTKKTKAKSRGAPAMRAWLPKSSPPEPSPHEIAISTAHDQIGKPYRWAGSGPGSFDCSGLVQFAYRHAGVALPHNSRAQYNHVQRISIEELQPGDLVFSGGRRIGHVGLYIGDGKMIHAPQSGRRVEIAPLRGNLIGAGRPLV